MTEPPDVDWPWTWADIANANGPMRFVNAYARQCAKRARAEAAAHCALIISSSKQLNEPGIVAPAAAQ